MIFDIFLKHKKIVGAVVLIIVLGIVFGGSISAKLTTKPSYKTIKVEKHDLTKVVSASGKVKSDEEAMLKFQTSGYLNWVGVKKGDPVKKWQVLATLDTAELEKQLKQELIDFQTEKTTFEADRRNNFIPDNQLNKYTLTDEIKDLVNNDQLTLDRTVLDVEIKNIALKYSKLWSPIDGIVTAIDVPNAGVNITAAGATITVSNPDKMIFSAKVDEADVGSVKVDQKAIVTLDAYPDEKFESSVSQIDFTSTITSSGGTAYEVKFSLPQNLEQKFKSGMNGDVEIETNKLTNIITVPYQVVREKNNQNYVYILKDGQPQKKNVKIGSESDNDTQITEGLKVGDSVITSDLATLDKIVK
jgi:RND family efflux transporter MFP subunit